MNAVSTKVEKIVEFKISRYDPEEQKELRVHVQSSDPEGNNCP